MNTNDIIAAALAFQRDPGLLERYILRKQDTITRLAGDAALGTEEVPVHYMVCATDANLERFARLGGTAKTVEKLEATFPQPVDAGETTQVGGESALRFQREVLDGGDEQWMYLVQSRLLIVVAEGLDEHVPFLYTSRQESVWFGHIELQRVIDEHLEKAAGVGGEETENTRNILTSLFLLFARWVQQGIVEADYHSEFQWWTFDAEGDLPELPLDPALRQLVQTLFGLDPATGDKEDILLTWAAVFNGVEAELEHGEGKRQEALLDTFDLAPLSEIRDRARALHRRLDKETSASTKGTVQGLFDEIRRASPRTAVYEVAHELVMKAWKLHEDTTPMAKDSAGRSPPVLMFASKYSTKDIEREALDVLKKLGWLDYTFHPTKTGAVKWDGGYEVRLSDRFYETVYSNDTLGYLDDTLVSAPKIAKDYLAVVDFFVDPTRSSGAVDTKGIATSIKLDPQTERDLANARLFSFNAQDVEEKLDSLFGLPASLLQMYDEAKCDDPIEEAMAYWAESDAATPFPEHLPYPVTYVGFSGKNRIVVWASADALETKAQRSTCYLSQWWLSFPEAHRDAVCLQGILLSEKGDAHALMSLHSRGKIEAYGIMRLATDGVWIQQTSCWPRLITALISAIHDHHTVVRPTKFSTKESRQRTMLNYKTKSQDRLDLTVRPRRFHVIQMKQGYFTERERRGEGGTGTIRTFRIFVRKHSWCKHIRGTLPIAQSDRLALTSTKKREHAYVVYRHGDPIKKDVLRELRKRLILPPMRGEWLAVMIIWKGQYWHPNDMSLPERETIHMTDPKVVEDNEEWTDETDPLDA